MYAFTLFLIYAFIGWAFCVFCANDEDLDESIDEVYAESSRVPIGKKYTKSILVFLVGVIWPISLWFFYIDPLLDRIFGDEE